MNETEKRNIKIYEIQEICIKIINMYNYFVYTYIFLLLSRAYIHTQINKMYKCCLLLLHSLTLHTLQCNTISKLDKRKTENSQHEENMPRKHFNTTQFFVIFLINLKHIFLIIQRNNENIHM